MAIGTQLKRDCSGVAIQNSWRLGRNSYPITQLGAALAGTKVSIAMRAHARNPAWKALVAIETQLKRDCSGERNSKLVAIETQLVSYHAIGCCTSGHQGQHGHASPCSYTGMDSSRGHQGATRTLMRRRTQLTTRSDWDATRSN